MKKLRIYIDTSVVGGVFDARFRVISEAFFEFAVRGNAALLVSDLLIEELQGAPEQVRAFVAGLPVEAIEDLARSDESQSLRDSYLEAKIVGVSSVDDAFHVAMATVAGADLIVSWNFRHFVNFEKIRGFNAVNLKNGYGLIDIRSPREVLPDDAE